MEMGKKIIAALSVFGLIFSFILLCLWIDYTNVASERVSEAECEYREALEDLAQAYANMPWTLDEIYADIDRLWNEGGYFRSYDDVIWLKNRVRQLRGG